MVAIFLNVMEIGDRYGRNGRVVGFPTFLNSW
jgi:hypothetical protein